MRSFSEIFRETLKQGCGRLSVSSREAVVAYIRSQETETGGFKNKAGEPDLYYTFFGLTCALHLGMKVNIRQHRAFLSRFDRKQLDLPHFTAHVQSVNLLQILSVPVFMQEQTIRAASHFIPSGVIRDVETLLRDPTRVPANDPDSPYSVFLASMVAGPETGNTLLPGRHTKQAPAYRLPSGGWSNIRGGTSPSLNATVSGMMLSCLTGEPVDAQTMEWVRKQQHPAGGFISVPGAPVPDLLSTATALLALKTVQVVPLYPVNGFIQAHWRNDGGFAGTFADETTDCEYTFYGLLALGASK